MYRCFEVGDCVKIMDEVLEVVSIQLLNTTFKDGSGETVYIANYVLPKLKIYNYKRSGIIIMFKYYIK